MRVLATKKASTLRQCPSPQLLVLRQPQSLLGRSSRPLPHQSLIVNSHPFFPSRIGVIDSFSLCFNSLICSSVMKESLDSHVKRCPFAKQARALESQPYFSKGINTSAVDCQDEIVSSGDKRKAIHGLTPLDFHHLITKIKSLHSTISSEMRDSFVIPEKCSKWMNEMLDRQVPFQEKHAVQQASIIGNMEAYGMIGKPYDECGESHGLHKEKGEGEVAAAIVEFGAGRGYLAHMLADCYGFNKVFLVERRSYKLK